MTLQGNITINYVHAQASTPLKVYIAFGNNPTRFNIPIVSTTFSTDAATDYVINYDLSSYLSTKAANAYVTFQIAFPTAKFYQCLDTFIPNFPMPSLTSSTTTVTPTPQKGSASHLKINWFGLIGLLIILFYLNLQ